MLVGKSTTTPGFDSKACRTPSKSSGCSPTATSALCYKGNKPRGIFCVPCFSGMLQNRELME